MFHADWRLPLQVSESLHLPVPVLLGLGQFPLVLGLQLRSLFLSLLRRRRQPFRQLFALLPRLRLPVRRRFLQHFHTSPARARTKRSRLKPCRSTPETLRAALELLVRVVDQLHVLLVPLLDVLQQHLGLVSFQLQGLHLSGGDT